MNTKSTIFKMCFYTSKLFAQNGMLRILGMPIRISYKIVIQWILGIDIPDTTNIGKNFTIYHGQSTVINGDTKIGDNVIIRQCTTIGNKDKEGGFPIINSNVDIGANSVIIGDIEIGENVTIAAGSVVINSFPENVVVAGNPAKIVKYKEGNGNKEEKIEYMK